MKILTLDEIKKAVEQVALDYDLARVILFGSYATGKRTARSDIDLLVEFSPTAIVTLFTLFRLERALRELTGKKVEIIHAPIEPDSLIKIEKEVLVYGQ